MLDKTGSRSARSAASDISEDLKERWDRIMLRISEPPGSPHRNLRELIRDDFEYRMIRLRYYHHYYPLQSVGVTAAATFLLGVVLGLGSD
jgi:ElaB/YqjD/DUF883 family membrane-anchored ribosome-binding protein